MHWVRCLPCAQRGTPYGTSSHQHPLPLDNAKASCNTKGQREDHKMKLARLHVACQVPDLFSSRVYSVQCTGCVGVIVLLLYSGLLYQMLTTQFDCRRHLVKKLKYIFLFFSSCSSIIIALFFVSVRCLALSVLAALLLCVLFIVLRFCWLWLWFSTSFYASAA